MKAQRHPLIKQQGEILQFDLDPAQRENVNTLLAVCWFEASYEDEIVGKALNLMLEHEQALRLRVGREGGQYVQYEQEYVRESIPTADYGSDDEAQVRARFEALAQEPIPLLDSPLYRLAIFHYGQGMGVSLKFHHIIMDGWSLALFAQQLMDYCKTLAEDRGPQPEKHDFTDCVTAILQRYCSSRYEKDRRYWRDFFAKQPILCRMRPDRPQVEESEGDRVQVPLDRQLSRRINDHCGQLNISPAVLFETALLLHLYRQNPGCSRVDIGQNMMNRGDLMEKDRLGMFTAERMLCVNLHDEDLIADVYRKIKESNMEAYYHGLCLHDEVLELAQAQHPQVAAIRDAEFSYLPCGDLKQRGCRMEWIANGAPEVSLEFTLFHMNDPDEFTVIFDYRKSAFTREEAEETLGRIIALAEKAMEDTNQKVGEVIG